MNKTLGEIQTSREDLIRSISREAGKKLKMLLEEKHIYQNVVIDAKASLAFGLRRSRRCRRAF